MTNYLYKNVRKIPSNLTCGDLMNMRDGLIGIILDCYKGIPIETREAIAGRIYSKFNRKILDAVDPLLGAMDSHSDDIASNPKTDKHLADTTNNLWSTSQQIPTIIHNVNEFGHTPKRNSVHKTKHILNTKAAEEVRALRNISRKFNLFVKNITSPIKKRKPANIRIADDAVHKYMIDISFDADENNIFIKFYNFSYLPPNYFYRFHINPVDKEINSRDFWLRYSRRVTKNIAKAIRVIDNNPNNWDYTEVERGNLD